MSVTNYKFAGSASNSSRTGSGSSWQNPTNAQESNGNYSTNSVPGSSYSDWLRLTNFGFTTLDIPSGSTIDGIEFAMNRYGSNNNINDSLIYLRKTSGQVGTDGSLGTWNNSPATEVLYGGSTSLWGTTWGTSDILSSDFGVDISISNSHRTQARMGYVDYIKIRIYYTHTLLNESNFFKLFY
jgi:hypothetical protein